jgi:two-component system, OmpR family, response regulator
MKKKLIFIVDDDEFFSQMLSDHLSKNPLFTIEICGTGEECIKKMGQEPDVIILDYYLNNVNPEAADGFQILQEIKKIDDRSCVIMLSSQEHYGKALQTIAKGALEYVVKDNEAFKKIDEILASL